MNVFRLLADFSHLFALIYLFYNICRSKSSAGISGKSQVLLALVFTARYIDIFWYFISYYNLGMKISFILLTYLTAFTTLVLYRKTYESENDSFPCVILIIFAFVLALFVHFQMTVLEISWTFSIYLEALAMWPQFYMIMIKTKQVRTHVLVYLLCLGFYRTMYVFNWAYRYFGENYLDEISTFSGLVQVLPFYVFIYLCLRKSIKITTNENTYYHKNITGDDEIFTIKVKEEFTKISSDKPLLAPLDT